MASSINFYSKALKSSEQEITSVNLSC